ncbi:MAG TPA: hypothetical protein VM243_11030, partial [Phycisphaerae bacterium]|nr:hypothetical protein [Phycisphaerae bacterium]
MINRRHLLENVPSPGLCAIMLFVLVSAAGTAYVQGAEGDDVEEAMRLVRAAVQRAAATPFEGTLRIRRVLPQETEQG